MRNGRAAIFKVLYNFGIGNLLLKLNRKHLKVPVLIFHKISSENDHIWPGISPKLFEEIIILLKKNYTILPLDQLLNKNENELRNACFITFDDGYSNFLTNAYPILKKHSVHSTVFVLPKDKVNQGHIWTSTIISFVKLYSIKEINNFFKGNNHNVDIGGSMNPFEINHAIVKYLCEQQQSDRLIIINKIRDKFASDAHFIEQELMSFDELKRLDCLLVSIQSHSLTHPCFKNEEERDFMENELNHSKELIEDSLKTKVEWFAFPFARYNTLSLELVKNCYKACFTRTNDLLDLHEFKKAKDYLYNLPRFNIHHGTAEEVFLLINGFHKNMGKALGKTKL